MRGVDPLGPAPIDPDQLRDVACDATASSTTCNPPDPRTPSPPRNGGGSVDIGWIGQLLTLVLVLALVALIAWLIYRWFATRELVDDDEEDADVELDEDLELDEDVDERVIDHETPPQRWRRQADEHRARGEYRDAVRCRYRALVGDLARAGFVDEIPGRTSGEERVQVADLAPRLGDHAADVVAAFAAAADAFDVAWFDDGIVTVDDDDRFVAAERTVLDAALASSSARFGRGR